MPIQFGAQLAQFMCTWVLGICSLHTGKVHLPHTATSGRRRQCQAIPAGGTTDLPQYPEVVQKTRVCVQANPMHGPNHTAKSTNLRFAKMLHGAWCTVHGEVQTSRPARYRW